MKTATIPALRVEPELRQAAENVLQPGETLSSFAEQALRSQIERRRAQQEFIARGLAAGKQARTDNEYYAADAVMAELDRMLADADAKAGR